jgi:hypothetical protein
VERLDQHRAAERFPLSVPNVSPGSQSKTEPAGPPEDDEQPTYSGSMPLDLYTGAACAPERNWIKFLAPLDSVAPGGMPATYTKFDGL